MKDIQLIYKLNKNWRPGTIKVKKAGGQTNRNWIVQYKNKKFFVRLPWERTDIVDRKIEAKNILALVKCKKLVGVIPKYFFYIFKKKNILKSQEIVNFPDGTMIMEYIEGKDIDGKDLERPNIQKALLKTLYTFHTSGVQFVNKYDVFRDEVLKYKNKAKNYPINKLIKAERIKKIERIEKIIKEKLTLGGKISTHNDLIFENLRLGKNEKVYLLDFEYAGYNIREGLHYDLGIILGGNLFQKNPIKLETFEDILKKAKKIYKGELNDYKVYCGALTNILVMFWWGLVKYFSSTKKEKKYFRSYVLKRAEGIEFLFQNINKTFKK
ncbi:MAG: phosphotransferase [bacterium]|nr:phosphotransferase [bacterium]